MTKSGPEVGQKWAGCVHLSVRTSVHPKHFPYLLDEPYARDLQAQGACALRFLLNINVKNNVYLCNNASMEQEYKIANFRTCPRSGQRTILQF